MKVVKYSKIILGILIVLCIYLGNTKIYANMPSADELHSQANNFITQGQNASKIPASTVAGLVKPVASILLGIGTVVVVAAAGVIGVKYVTGSPEQHAKLKTQLIRLVVSIVVLYGAFGIWSLAYRLLSDITS
ncbi:MAG: hypothetical protein FWF46_02775 [Oscillospiraceae bacterium]|nr:hypothetical protein [Oscillospiraceae bacterium]